jgi:polysaccharide chain length determinant protein (PEP-CTERM system associated)
MNVDEGLNLGDLRGLVERRWPATAIVAGVVFLAGIVIAAVLPNQYTTYTTILVEPQTISADLIEAQMGGTDLNERLHLMTMQILSRPRLSRIIDDLGLYEVESEEMTREEVIELMRSRIEVVPVLPELEEELQSTRREIVINTFRLSFRHESPQLAAAVANRLANDFIEEHIRERVQISTDTSEFIEAELARLAVQIQDVEARIAQVKNENPGRLPEDMTANQRVYERTIENLRHAQYRLAEAQSDEGFYRQQAAISPDYGARDSADPKRRLELMELELNTMLSRGYTEKHPDVIAKHFEIEELREKLSKVEAEEAAEERPVSAAQQASEAERRRAALRIEAAREELSRLQAQADEVQQRLADTPRVAERLGALERDYEHLFRSFQEYSNKRLDASVAANAERRQKGEKLRVLESAVAPPDPTSPNRPLIVLMGALLGMALGGATGVLLEASDGSFHGGRALQGAFQLPVLAQIPSITLESDRVALRRRRAIATVATAGIVGVVLVGAVAGYWMVNRGGGGDAATPAQSPTTQQEAPQ